MLSEKITYARPVRSSIAAAWFCMCASLGCDSDKSPGEPELHLEEPTPEVSAPEHPPIGAWVVLDERRAMLTAPSLAGVRLPTGPTPHIRVAEVVSLVGDFVEVRTIARKRGTVCASDRGVASAYELRFFVELEALLPVLSRPKVVELDDGTKLELVAGMPVTPSFPGGTVRLGDTQLRASVDEADIGRWFAAPPIEANVASEPRIIEDGQLLTFVHPCGRFTLRTEPGVTESDLLAQSLPRGPLLDEDDVWGTRDDHKDYAWGGLLSCSPFRWTAAPGTKLTWRSGGEAGVVLESMQLSDATQDGDRLCFTETLDLEVCIEAAKLERTGESDCDPPVQLEPTGKLPRVQQAKLEVGDGLDRDIVRRIVRAHIEELDACYDTARREHPKLAGRLEIAFEIDARGKVSSSRVHATALEPNDAAVAKCFVKASKRWMYPKPQSHPSVRVIYPFVLLPG